MLKQLFVVPLYNPPDICTSGDSPNVMTALLGDIRTNQLLAMEALFQNGLYASDEMQELLEDVLGLSEQIRLWLPRTVVANESAFIDHLLTELVTYQPRNSAERVRRAEILVTIADTNVLRAHRSRRFRDYDEVLEQYRQAHAMMQREGVDQAVLDELFSPAIPVMLPAYRRNPLQGNEADAAAGYIDVVFDVTQRGQSRRIRVQGMSEGIERADRHRLSENIRMGKFRPRMVNGEFPATVPVSLRYYLR